MKIMKNIIKLFSFLFVILLFASCEDFFETTLDIDPPEFEELLVIHAYANGRTNELEVSVAKSVGLLDSPSRSGNDLINNAEVKLITESGTYTLQATTSDNFPVNYVLPANTVEFVGGQTYTLEVIAEGFPTATAVSTMPLQATIGDIDFELDGPSDGFDDYSSIEFTLSDPEGIENYYESFFLERSVVNGQDFFSPSRYLDYLDPVMEEGLSYDSVQLRDDSFDGLDKSVQLLVDEWLASGNNPDIFLIDDLFVIFRDVSFAHYKYNVTAVQNNRTSENPFVSPVQVYTNIENGIGVFSMFQERRLKVI